MLFSADGASCFWFVAVTTFDATTSGGAVEGSVTADMATEAGFATTVATIGATAAVGREAACAGAGLFSFDCCLGGLSLALLAGGAGGRCSLLNAEAAGG